MNDNNADYEVVESIAARSLANLFKDRTVTGTAYVIYDDKNDSDLEMCIRDSRMAASSFMAIWKEPSPQTTTVCLPGFATLTPIAAGRA